MRATATWCIWSLTIYMISDLTSAFSESPPQEDEIRVYIGNGSYAIPNSEWTRELGEIGLDLSGANSDGISGGVMIQESPRRFFDISATFYGTKDRTLIDRSVFEADYAVRTIELTGHWVLIHNEPLLLTLFTGYGYAQVKDRRKFGGLVDIDDKVTAWPFTIGTRVVFDKMRIISKWLVPYMDARYRVLNLTYKRTQTVDTFFGPAEREVSSTFKLGGPSFYSGLMYRVN